MHPDIRILLLCALVFAQGTTTPVIDVKNGKTSLRLPPAMRRVLDRYDATFRVWNYDAFADWVRRGAPPTDRAALSAIVGDFNGDRRPDIVLNGHTQGDGVTVVLLSDSSEYRAVEVSRAPGDTVATGREEYLELTPPGPIELPISASGDSVWTAVAPESPTPGQRILHLKTDAFSLLFDDKGGALCIYAKGRFWWISSPD